MEFQTLKKSHLRRNIVIGVVVIAIISAIVINFTRAKYRNTQSIPLVNGTINYSPGDIIVTAYFNEEKLEKFPNKNNKYTVKKVICDNEATATFDEDNWTIKIINLEKRGTKCDIYFEEIISKTMSEIIANLPLGEGTPNFNNTSCSTGCEEKTIGIYTAEDDDGTSYYFRGDVDNNWLKFAGYYWRIIRVNGDGSIRLIYSGTTTDATNDELMIKSSSYNSGSAYYYAGFKYGISQDYGTEYKSTALIELETWYENELKQYENNIDYNAMFCNRRDYSTYNGVNYTFKAYDGLVNSKNPTYKCPSSGSQFTTTISNRGNKTLTYPIGLITADEAAYAGAVFGKTNNKYYLYAGNSFYWTLTPSQKTQYGSVNMFFLSSTISEQGAAQSNNMWLRPVINLKGETLLIGKGTPNNPYVIEGAE